MSDIKVGDLVQVIRACPNCGCNHSIGDIFTVEWIGISHGSSGCCGYNTPELCADEDRNGPLCIPINRLKRIPPLSELESTEHKEELTA